MFENNFQKPGLIFRVYADGTVLGEHEGSQPLSKSVHGDVIAETRASHIDPERDPSAMIDWLYEARRKGAKPNALLAIWRSANMHTRLGPGADESFREMIFGADRDKHAEPIIPGEYHLDLLAEVLLLRDKDQSESRYDEIRTNLRQLRQLASSGTATCAAWALERLVELCSKDNPPPPTRDDVQYTLDWARITTVEDLKVILQAAKLDVQSHARDPENSPLADYIKPVAADETTEKN